MLLVHGDGQIKLKKGLHLFLEKKPHKSLCFQWTTGPVRLIPLQSLTIVDRRSVYIIEVATRLSWEDEVDVTSAPSAKWSAFSPGPTKSRRGISRGLAVPQCHWSMSKIGIKMQSRTNTLIYENICKNKCLNWTETCSETINIYLLIVLPPLRMDFTLLTIAS